MRLRYLRAEKHICSTILSLYLSVSLSLSSVEHLIFIFDLLLWVFFISFFQIDTLNLFTYAVLRLTPLALFHGASSWSYSRKTYTACDTYAGALLVNSGSAVDQYYNSHDTSPLRRHSYPLVRPLQHSKWSKGKDGFLTTDIWGTEVNSLVPTCPTIWLHQTEEKMFLLAYQHRGLTVILLVPVSSVSGEQGIAMLKQQILENVSLHFLLMLKKLNFCMN